MRGYICIHVYAREEDVIAKETSNAHGHRHTRNQKAKKWSLWHSTVLAVRSYRRSTQHNAMECIYTQSDRQSVMREMELRRGFLPLCRAWLERDFIAYTGHSQHADQPPGAPCTQWRASDVAIHDYEIIIIIIVVVVVVVVVSDDDDKSCTFEDVVKTQLDLQSYFSVYEKIQNN